MENVMPKNNIDGRFGAEREAKPRAKTPSPWSVRGVSREARAKAAKAAARRRETIGEWVTNALTLAANDELGTGPRRERPADVQGGLPAGPEQDETPLGKALLALAERFERSEKRNDAIASLTRRMEGIEHGGRDVDVLAEQIGLVEQRSRALTLLAERLEGAERREKSLLTVMQNVAERAERGEERIASITRGLADLAIKLEAALSSNRVHTARNISDSVAPLESAVRALGARIAATPPPAQPAPQPAPQQRGAPMSGPTASHYYGAPDEPWHGETGRGSPAPGPASAPAASATRAAPAEDSKENNGRLKFDFKALNERAIQNSQRMAPGSGDGDGKKSEGGWFGKKSEAKSDAKSGGQKPAKPNGDGDWAEEIMVAEEAAADAAEDSRAKEPKLDGAPPASSAPSEEDEMLAALKHAIKPEKR